MEAKIICLYTSGHKIEEICWLLNVDRATIRSVLVDMYEGIEHAKHNYQTRGYLYDFLGTELVNNFKEATSF